MTSKILAEAFLAVGILMLPCDLENNTSAKRTGTYMDCDANV
jgi:hypothetical protein